MTAAALTAASPARPSRSDAIAAGRAAYAAERLHHLALADGRTLSYGLYGAGDGPLVVVLDGPGSRGLARASDGFAKDLGIGLVAPDRPGFFESTPAERPIAAWPEDHAALLDHLGADTAGIVSQSGGTPYALAAAAALPDRVTGLAMLGAVAPMYDDIPYSAAGKQLRVGTKLARRAPWLLRLFLKQSGRAATKDPEKAGAKLAKAVPAADRKALEDPDLYALHVNTSAQILTSDPDAIVREIGLLSQPWEVDFAEVRAPRAFWTGDSDETHPVPHARYLAERLGDPPVNVIPDAATFGLVPIYPDALRLAASL